MRKGLTALLILALVAGHCEAGPFARLFPRLAQRRSAPRQTVEPPLVPQSQRIGPYSGICQGVNGQYEVMPVASPGAAQRATSPGCRVVNGQLFCPLPR